MNIVFEEWPNAIKTASGGTRNEIKLSRPWQLDIVVNPEKCPFCKSEEKRISIFGDGWQVLENLFTPYEFHRLIIPGKCWPKEKVRMLGGLNNIKRALEIALSVVKENPGIDFCLGVHVGFYAGQNVSHLHYHLLKPFNSPNFEQIRDKLAIYCQRPSHVIFKARRWTVIAGGIRAGQCFIVPDDSSPTFDENIIPDLAVVLNKLINLYNRKFQSNQGLAPDYRLTIRIKKQCRIFAAWYVPILNHWGFDHDTAFIENQPIILPWPHETTVKFLKKES